MRVDFTHILYLDIQHLTLFFGFFSTATAHPTRPALPPTRGFYIPFIHSFFQHAETKARASSSTPESADMIANRGSDCERGESV
ncbi:hypothetical protein BOTBODRAFT_441357 [Botryobasidium botryosum FD-172 SS1]|uniref:Uncharacterized protein n=1 Tax=Botryobasidium botryosum (strain FD-172 SS1) TaxID=930990 RepID=A0A067N6W2_BOTB1|nr:hypothetical protein BOTBODRAFT_441357 [Botryobasidium botryosum FD-172 SS1]